MAMQARVVFQGLISFLRDRPSRAEWEGDESRTMAALPINLPGHGPKHEHRPRLSWRATTVGGFVTFQPPIDITGCRVEFVWVNQAGEEVRPTTPLTLDSTFDKYVPQYGWFVPSTEPRPKVRPAFRQFRKRPPPPVVSQVILAHGTLRVSRTISRPDGPGMPPRDRDVRFRRAGKGSQVDNRSLTLAEECVLESLGPPPSATGLRVTIYNYTKKKVTHQEILYGDIELLVQNLSAHGQAPSNYGVHFKHFFQLVDPASRKWLQNRKNHSKDPQLPDPAPPDEAAEDAHFPDRFPYPVIPPASGKPTPPSPLHDAGSGPICPPMDDE